MESLKIIFTSIILAIFYGICHDLVTANISVEYFTIGHPKIIDSESPFILALVWGVFATWWVGLILGVFISIAARLGVNPKLQYKDVIKPMVILLCIMGGVAILAGILGYFLAKAEVIYLVGKLSDQIDSNLHHLFLAAGWAHASSYIIGFLGGLVLSILLWKRRNVMIEKFV
jgi:hypothetical protein